MDKGTEHNEADNRKEIWEPRHHESSGEPPITKKKLPREAASKDQRPPLPKPSGPACSLCTDPTQLSNLCCFCPSKPEWKIGLTNIGLQTALAYNCPFLSGTGPSTEAGFSSSHNGHHLGSRDCIWHQLVLSPNWSSTLALLPATGFGRGQILAECLLLPMTSISDLHFRPTRPTAVTIMSSLVPGKNQLSTFTVCPKDLVNRDSLSNSERVRMLFLVSTAKSTFHVWNDGWA